MKNTTNTSTTSNSQYSYEYSYETYACNQSIAHSLLSLYIHTLNASTFPSILSGALNLSSNTSAVTLTFNQFDVNLTNSFHSLLDEWNPNQTTFNPIYCDLKYSIFPWKVSVPLILYVSSTEVVDYANTTTQILLSAVLDIPNIPIHCVYDENGYRYYRQSITPNGTRNGTDIYQYRFETYFCNETTASLVVDWYNNVTIPLLTSMSSIDSAGGSLTAVVNQRDDILSADDIVKIGEAEAKESNPTPSPTVDWDELLGDNGNNSNMTLIIILSVGGALLVILMCAVIVVLWEFDRRKKAMKMRITPGMTSGVTIGMSSCAETNGLSTPLLTADIALTADLPETDGLVTRDGATSLYPDLPQEEIPGVTKDDDTHDSDSDVWNDAGTAGMDKVVTPGMEPVAMNGNHSGITVRDPETLELHQITEQMDHNMTSTKMATKITNSEISPATQMEDVFQRTGSCGSVSDGIYETDFKTKDGDTKGESKGRTWTDSSVMYESGGMTNGDYVTPEMEELPDEQEKASNDEES